MWSTCLVQTCAREGEVRLVYNQVFSNFCSFFAVSRLIVRMVICSLLSIYSLFSSAMAANKERTFIMIKPDGVHRGLVGKIMERFEAKGFKLVALKFTWVS